MKISKPVKIIIGILTAFVTVMPFVILLSYLLMFALMIGSAVIADQSAMSENTFVLFFSIFMIPFYLLMMLYTGIHFGLRIFYIIHILMNKHLAESSRILFVLGTFHLSFVAMPIYFFKWFWKEHPAVPQSTKISA